MATVPRPLSSESAITAAAGPKANSVAMRRSKASAPCALGARGRGQISAAATTRAGSRKATWPNANSDRVEDVVEQSARGRGARIDMGKGQEIIAHEPKQVGSRQDECHREGRPGSRGTERLARIAVEQQEQRKR